jgi:hypothetical protein
MPGAHLWGLLVRRGAVEGVDIFQIFYQQFSHIKLRGKSSPTIARCRRASEAQSIVPRRERGIPTMRYCEFV